MKKLILSNFVLISLALAQANAPNQHGVLLTPVPAAQPTGLTITKFNFYKGTTKGGPYVLLGNSTNVTTPTYQDGCASPAPAGCISTLVEGSTYYYVSTAVSSSNVESVYSPEAVAVIPNTQPLPPTGLSTKVN